MGANHTWNHPFRRRWEPRCNRVEAPSERPYFGRRLCFFGLLVVAAAALGLRVKDNLWRRWVWGVWNIVAVLFRVFAPVIRFEWRVALAMESLCSRRTSIV